MYGQFLRRVRASRGMTQSELAEVSGIRQSNVSAIECDRRLPSADTLNRWLVSCGYQLAATAGERTLRCPLPVGGWFPDEEMPPVDTGDPATGPPTVDRDTPMSVRVRLVTAALDAAEAVVRARARAR